MRADDCYNTRRTSLKRMEHAVWAKRVRACVIAVVFASGCLQLQTAQAQTYQTPGTFVAGSGVTGQNGSAQFQFNNGTNVTVRFDVAGATTGGGYGYGMRTPSSNLGAGGNPAQSDFYQLPSALTVTPASIIDAWGRGCPPPGIGDPINGTICGGRGRLTITFSQPVINPVLHLGGLGVVAPPRFNAVYTLTSASNGATPVSATIAFLTGNNNHFGVSGNTIRSTVDAAVVDAGCPENPAAQAACGSVRINGTVTQLVFDVSVRGYSTSAYPNSQSTAIADGHLLSASVLPVANLVVTKTNNQTTYTPGQATTYVITVANRATVANPTVNTVVGANVVDNFPAALTGITWTASYSAGASGPASGSGNINASVTLAPESVATFTVNATVIASASGDLVNTATATVPTSVVELAPADNAATDTDVRNGNLVLTKITNGGTGTFGFTHTNTTPASSSITTTAVGGTGTSGPPLNIVSSGAQIVITENAVAGWRLDTIVCSKPTGGGQFDPVYNIPARQVTIPNNNVNAGATFACIFTNSVVADLSITKTNTPAAGPNDQAADTVVSGTTTTYTLVVTNNSIVAVTGARVQDTPGAGITCPPGNPVTITGNGVPAGTFTVANLTAGIALNTLNSGQTATLTFVCNVN